MGCWKGGVWEGGRELRLSGVLLLFLRGVMVGLESFGWILLWFLLGQGAGCGRHYYLMNRFTKYENSRLQCHVGDDSPQLLLGLASFSGLSHTVGSADWR